METGTFQPEPFLPDKEYDFILSVTSSMAKVIERSPANFASLDEEAIRDHFLIQLNGHYEGQASGETFNSAGKTDILLRHGDRNVFIAECKIWKGAKKFAEAIDQLLGYLTWRDCKCAIFVFNRNQDSTAVAAKMHEIVEARPEHRKTVNHSTQGDSRYVFVKENQPGREIIITTQLYDVPMNHKFDTIKQELAEGFQTVRQDLVEAKRERAEILRRVEAEASAADDTLEKVVALTERVDIIEEHLALSKS